MMKLIRLWFELKKKVCLGKLNTTPLSEEIHITKTIPSNNKHCTKRKQLGIS